MSRRHDWPQRLALYLEQRRATPFEWGVHDCCRFAAGAVEAMTGRNRMDHFAYSTELGAARLIQRAGGLEVLLRETLGEPLPSLGQAQRGDVVLADLESGPTVGVFLGRVAAFAADIGITWRSATVCHLAWRIA